MYKTSSLQETYELQSSEIRHLSCEAEEAFITFSAQNINILLHRVNTMKDTHIYVILETESLTYRFSIWDFALNNYKQF